MANPPPEHAGNATEPPGPVTLGYTEVNQTLEPTDYTPDPGFQLRGNYKNLMVDAAMPLFGLMMRLRTLDELPNIEQVHAKVCNQIRAIQEEMRQHGYAAEDIAAYSYSLCLYLDEGVMSRPWGINSCWSQTPLLSVFHDETQGGEKVFTLLSRLMQEPKRYKDVLELMYLCLCFGLKGKYALVPKGDEAIKALIDALYEKVRQASDPVPQQLCDPLSNVVQRKDRLKWQWPWWSPLVICAVLMFVAYSVYSYRLELVTREVLESLDYILKDLPPPPCPPQGCH